MKRLAMIAATGIMALMISACGDNAPQKPEMQQDDMQAQMQKPMTEESVEAVEIVEPAEPAEPATQPAQPSDEAMDDAAAQE